MKRYGLLSIECVGFALIIGGVAVIYWPAAVIMAGVMGIIIGQVK